MSTTRQPAKKQQAPAKKAPAKKAPAKKAPKPSRKQTEAAAANAAAETSRRPDKQSPPAVEPAQPATAEVTSNPEDALLAGLREEAQRLRAEEKLTMMEIAQRLGVSNAVAREAVEGTPRGKPRKASGSTGSATGRVRGNTVQVETLDGTLTCRACGLTKPVRQFPTVNGPLTRSDECRACRDARREARAVTPA